MNSKQIGNIGIFALLFTLIWMIGSCLIIRDLYPNMNARILALWTTVPPIVVNIISLIILIRNKHE
jgi:hypothetical protein